MNDTVGTNASDNRKGLSGTPAHAWTPAKGTLSSMTALEMRGLVARGEVSAEDLVKTALDRAVEVQPQLNPFVQIRREAALSEARQADARRRRGETMGPLDGVPIVMKDMTETAGDVFTEGSRLFEGRIGRRDISIAGALKGAGGIVVAKAATPEFSWAGDTQSPLWGVTRNPWNPRHTCGGSSGGSAVAVATGCVPLAEGTDAGGSIRIPASACGIVGLKPSLGRIDYDGLSNMLDSLSHWGPLARNCDDAALFLDIAQYKDSQADYFNRAPVDFLARIGEAAPADIKVAVSPDLGCFDVDPEIVATLRAFAEKISRLGMGVEDVRLPWIPEYHLTLDREWSVWMAFNFGKVSEGREHLLDPLVRRAIDEGWQVSATDFRRGELMRTQMWESLRPILRDHDVLICPTMSQDVPLADEPFPGDRVMDDGKLSCAYMTSPFNMLSRLPVLSLPMGVLASGLPIGVQIIGRPQADLRVLQVGRLIEAGLSGNGGL